MTSAAVAEQVRALRMEAAPGIRVLVGLRSLDVENSYLRLWTSRSGLASTANLAYEWLRRTGLDGIALTNLVVGRHTVDVYVQFLKAVQLHCLRVARRETSAVPLIRAQRPGLLPERHLERHHRFLGGQNPAPRTTDGPYVRVPKPGCDAVPPVRPTKAARPDMPQLLPRVIPDALPRVDSGEVRARRRGQHCACAPTADRRRRDIGQLRQRDHPCQQGVYAAHHAQA
ncbi:uncharacterized protein LOC144100101 isoform X1 [Amblyomma americanum]